MHTVATAGHVDHGKSALVQALTGTDPDRWEEEKRRGLTIDLGFAFVSLADGTEVAFVDVPGHVRFLSNMLSGAGAVRAAVLVVAATEGWMPQSEEHLRILELLGVRAGFTVLTKADLVDDEALEIAELDVLEHLEGSWLADERVVVCDSLSGRGVDDVRAALAELAARLPAAPDEGRPRLWVDRAFAVRGAGTVVTGTLAGGSVAVGDEVEVAPDGLRARVRGVQIGHRQVDRGAPGARVALNLAGVDHGRVDRGDAVVLPEQWAVTATFDAALTLLPGHAARRRSRWRAHVGSGGQPAVVRRLDDHHARVHLRGPCPLAPGDRVLLRDPGRDVTVGGAEVLDVDPVGPRRDAPGRLSLPVGERILAGRPVVSVPVLARLAGLSADRAAGLADDLVHAGGARRSGGLLVRAEVADAAAALARRRVPEHHRAHPTDRGLPLPVLAGELDLAADVLADVLRAAGFAVEEGCVREPGHVPDVREDPRARKLLDALEAAPFSPPDAGEVGAPREVVRALEREGLVVRVGELVFAASAVEEARRRLAELLAGEGSVTVAGVRDALGTTRRYVLPLLGHFDALGMTRRRGDVRVAGPRLGDP